MLKCPENGLLKRQNPGTFLARHAGREKCSGPAGHRRSTRRGNPETAQHRHQQVRNRPPAQNRPYIGAQDSDLTYGWEKYERLPL
jgi:hypothetical protein